jgi:hypothetical protein
VWVCAPAPAVKKRKAAKSGNVFIQGLQKFGTAITWSFEKVFYGYLNRSLRIRTTAVQQQNKGKWAGKKEQAHTASGHGKGTTLNYIEKHRPW